MHLSFLDLVKQCGRKLSGLLRNNNVGIISLLPFPGGKVEVTQSKQVFEICGSNLRFEHRKTLGLEIMISDSHHTSGTPLGPTYHILVSTVALMALRVGALRSRFWVCVVLSPRPEMEVGRILGR